MTTRRWQREPNRSLRGQAHWTSPQWQPPQPTLHLVVPDSSLGREITSVLDFGFHGSIMPPCESGFKLRSSYFWWVF